MSNQHNQKIELTPQQTNPYTARPELRSRPTRAGKQSARARSTRIIRREEYLLLALRKAKGRGVTLPTE